MLRRLIACLALLTGLAAVGTPASAALLGAMSEQAQASATTAQPNKKDPCVVVKGDRSTAPVDCEQDGTKKRREPVVIYIPTVQFGADRAFE